MEASLSHVTSAPLSLAFLPRTQPSPALRQPWSRSRSRRVPVALRCVSGSGSLERELEAEVSREEWLNFGRLKEKCGGGKGVVELLECLEREALMGEDHGRDPTDYDRRAKIFTTSSRIFQALKHHLSDA